MMRDCFDTLDPLKERERSVKDTELPCRISLFQALPDGDKMDQIILRAVELGVKEIVPMQTDRMDNLPEEEAKARVKCWNEAASREAGHALRTFVPQVKPVMAFADAVQYASDFDRKFIPYEMEKGMKKTREEFEKIQPGDTVAVLIGPEKGFDTEEIALAEKAGIVPVTLGRRVLRTETAGLYVLSVLVYLLEEEW